MNTCAITTCSAKGWAEYGHRMVDTFARFWPADVSLTVYTEGFKLPSAPNVIEAHFPPWFTRWKQRHAHNADAHGRLKIRNRRGREYDFRRDCVKFAHKVAAITDASEGLDADQVLWMDADVLTHEPVDHAWLGRLFPFAVPGYMAWLERTRVYPECGFMIFRPRDPMHARFMARFRDVYESDQVFAMSETHDSFVLAELVRKAVREAWFPTPYNLSGEAKTSHHPFVFSSLAERLDHAKGSRKAHGRTPSIELNGRRDEAHWRLT